MTEGLARKWWGPSADCVEVSLAPGSRSGKGRPGTEAAAGTVAACVAAEHGGHEQEGRLGYL